VQKSFEVNGYLVKAELGPGWGVNPGHVFAFLEDVVWRGVACGLAFTQYCHYQYFIVYGIKGGAGGGGVYCAMVVELYCNRVGFAGGGGGEKKEGLNKKLR